MKIILILIIVVLTSPCSVSAEGKNISVQWTIENTNGVNGYRLYFASNVKMIDKKLACGTSNPESTSLTCMDVNLSKSPAYFTLAAVTSTSEISSFPVGKEFSNSSNNILLFIAPQLLEDNENNK